MRLKIINTLTLIGVILVNALANILPINGVTTGEVSARYDTYFTPAGFTFSIWSVIYLLLIIYSIYQYRKSYNSSTIGYWFALNGLANMLWILTWHYDLIELTYVLMLVILGSLIVINTKIRNESLLVRLAFGIYLGWICVATVANTSVLLKSWSWNGWGINESSWAIAVLITAGLIGYVLIKVQKNISAALAIAWGTFGILMRWRELDSKWQIQISALLVMVVIISISSFVMIKEIIKKQHHVAS